MVRITHPFHPLYGREYRLVTYRKNWGEDRLYFHNEEGRLVGVPAHWTDFFGLDPFQEVAAGDQRAQPGVLQLLGSPEYPPMDAKDRQVPSRQCEAAAVMSNSVP